MTVTDTESDSDSGGNVCGLTRIAASPLDRTPVRLRDSAVTTSAWRLDLTCDQGAGSIVKIETPAGDTFYRGDGLFLGWAQEQMAEVYETVTRPAGGGDSSFELIQLG